MNTKFAIDLIEEAPPKPCKERVVWCDGGSGPIGHPKVYINLVCGKIILSFYMITKN